MLVDMVTMAELGETLSGEGPFTVFAPTNEAFAKVMNLNWPTLQLVTNWTSQTFEKYKWSNFDPKFVLNVIYGRRQITLI